MIRRGTVVLLVLISYAVDVAKPGAIDKRLKAALTDADMKKLMDRQRLRKTIAQQRPDMLPLINLVNESGEGGIKLTGVHFKKGQPVSVKGQAPSPEQLYKFQEAILDKGGKDVRNVKIQSRSKEAKGNKWNFTITFQYKRFSEKKAAR